MSGIGGRAGCGGRRPAVLIGAALALLVLAIYLPVAGHDFVDLDDRQYVVDNPPVLGGLTAQGLTWAVRATHAGNWHPLTWISHMLDVRLFGLDAGRHHLTNVAIHLASTLLLFLVLASATAAPVRSGVVAALFAAHPLHVESVAWVSERKDVLCSLFWLLALCAYVRHVRRPRGGLPFAALALFALALATKPMAVTFPFVLLLLDWWPLGRLAWPRGNGGGEAPAPAGRIAALVAEKLPFFLLAAGASAITLAAQREAGAVNVTLSFGARLANALVSYVAYLAKAAWPAHLSVFYPYERHGAAAVAGALALLALVTAVSLAAARRLPALAVGWLWYLGMLVPVIGLVQVGGQAMADRYTYLPLVGVFVALAWAVPVPRPGLRRVLAGAGAALLIGALAATARTQVGRWADTFTLFDHALRNNADNWHVHAALGKALNDRGRTAQAVAELELSLRINPRHAEAHNNLGIALSRQGKSEEALARFREAVRLKPKFVEARGNLASVLAGQGRTDEAREQFLETVRRRPDYARGHYNFGVFLERLGERDEASASFRRALELNPYLTEARRRLEALGAASGTRAGAGR